MITAAMVLEPNIRKNYTTSVSIGSTGWRSDPANYKTLEECTLIHPGFVNISPAWYEIGKEVRRFESHLWCVLSFIWLRTRRTQRLRHHRC